MSSQYLSISQAEQQKKKKQRSFVFSVHMNMSQNLLDFLEVFVPFNAI